MFSIKFPFNLHGVDITFRIIIIDHDSFYLYVDLIST